jgi:hypothetical protein
MTELNRYESMNNRQLVEEYNSLATRLGRPTVQKFRDLATARRRTFDLANDAGEFSEGAGAQQGNAQGEDDTAEVEPEGEDFVSQMKLRGGTLKAAVVERLLASLGEFVPEEELVEAAYIGGDAEKAKGNLKMILRGVKVAIERNGVPLRLENQRSPSAYRLARS